MNLSKSALSRFDIAEKFTYSVNKCGLGVPIMHIQKGMVEPYVFHMQQWGVKKFPSKKRPINEWNAFRVTNWGSRILPVFAFSWFAGIISTEMAVAEDDPQCLDYYSVGDSDCRPVASTPLSAKASEVEEKTVTKPSEKPKSAVDQYLENYGKPPREFVEFYLNPTTENANQWMQTYRQMLSKGQDLSKAWQEADQLYTSTDDVTAGLQKEPSLPQLPANTKIEAIPSVTLSSPTGVKSIGAFSGAPNQQKESIGGIRAPSVSLTYYFSQTCPYCAKMTPQLAEISKDIKSKLVFTCVDVTPLGAQTKPNAAFITTKLPCKWRLPEAGEVERENIQQTPTLLIQREGSAEMRLSGYVPLVQLRQYF